MILLTGGSGLLGTELQKLIDCYAPPRKELDITKTIKIPPETELIIHAAAYTDVEAPEHKISEMNKCAEININGTKKITSLGVPVVYISTEYVFDGWLGDYKEHDATHPVNWYGVTKLWGETYTAQAPRSLIIRCLFKKRPWKYGAAFTDQFTSGDYVDVMAPQIAKAIQLFDRFDPHDIVHIGTGKKCIFELAKQSRPDVKPITRSKVLVKIPMDTSLNTDYWESICR